jgi:hypothetical protein
VLECVCISAIRSSLENDVGHPGLNTAQVCKALST